MTLAPSATGDTFDCQHYRCRLRTEACVQRQVAQTEAHGTQAARPRFEFCASGKCSQGVAIRERLTPPPAPVLDRPALLAELEAGTIAAALKLGATDFDAHRIRFANGTQLEVPRLRGELRTLAGLPTHTIEDLMADANLCTDPDHEGPAAPAAKGRKDRCRACYDRNWRQKQRREAKARPGRAIGAPAVDSGTAPDLKRLGVVELARLFESLEAQAAQAAAELRSRLEPRQRGSVG